MCGYPSAEKTVYIIIIIFLGLIFTVEIIWKEENIVTIIIDLLSYC